LTPPAFNSEQSATAHAVMPDFRTKMPDILNLLLRDQTRSLPDAPHNIIWANDNYTHIDPIAYAPTAQITPNLITGTHSTLIVPRALKTADLQKERTKTRAEVFTPTWIVRKQNNAVNAAYCRDDLKTYVCRKWLEITCGEAPYMATRYDMESGDTIPLHRRCGFVDRKLARINKKVADKGEWQILATLAYKASYGFEWNGDSLLLARENLLYTFCDYYQAKWQTAPTELVLHDIATIISFNLFQMDGLTGTIPLSQKRIKKENPQQLFSFADNDEGEKEEYEITPGEPAKIMDWDTLEMVAFHQLPEAVQ